MKKLLWLIVILVVLIGGAGVYVFMNAGALIKDGVETYGPDYVQAPVSVSAVRLSPFSGKGEIRGLTLGNPAGYEGPHALKLGTARIALDPEQLGGNLDVIELQEFTIDGADIQAIFKSKDESNLAQLVTNLQRAAGVNSAAETGTGDTPKLIIRQLNLTNITATITSAVVQDVAIAVPDVTLTDVGAATGGATFAEIGEAVMQPIVRSVTREVVRQGLQLDDLEEKAKTRVREKLSEKLGKGLRSITEKLGHPE